jgi:hypothetical protein
MSTFMDADPGRAPEIVELLALHGLGRLLAAEGATDAEWKRYRTWRDRVLAAVDHSVQALEMIAQDPHCSVWPTGINDGVTELCGHDGCLGLVAPGEEDAATKEPHRCDHVAEVGAGF